MATIVDIFDLKHLCANLKMWIERLSSDADVIDSLKSSLQTANLSMKKLETAKAEELRKRGKEKKLRKNGTNNSGQSRNIKTGGTFVSHKEKQQQRQRPVICHKCNSTHHFQKNLIFKSNSCRYIITTLPALHFSSPGLGRLSCETNVQETH